MPDGGPRFPDSADGSYQLPVSQHFDVCVPVLSKDAIDSSTGDMRGNARKLHATLGHASAHHLKRILVGAEGAGERLLNFADEVVGQREVSTSLR